MPKTYFALSRVSEDGIFWRRFLSDMNVNAIPVFDSERDAYEALKVINAPDPIQPKYHVVKVKL